MEAFFGKQNFDSSDFDEMSWHDSLVYGIVFPTQHYPEDLVLDIDYLTGWQCGPDCACTYWIVPSTLRFHDVVDLSIDLDWGTSIYKKEDPKYAPIHRPSTELIIMHVTREKYDDPLYVVKGTARYRYDFELNTGKMSFGALDYRQVGRQEPIRSDSEVVENMKRVPLSGV